MEQYISVRVTVMNSREQSAGVAWLCGTC